MLHITEVLSKNYEKMSLCTLHRPCSVERGCDTPSCYSVFDFDRITRDYRQRKKLPSCASVDALVESEAVVYLVEMKGWKEFLKRVSNVSEDKIRKQVNKYDLAQKLVDSVATCLGLLNESDPGQGDVFLSIPKCYVIVTDIYPQQNPLASIASNLNLLAETSSDWKTVCWDRLEEKALQMKGIKTLFISCREFDSLFV